MKPTFIIAFILAAALPIVASSAQAQTYEDYQRRHGDLIALSTVFGELHHIRRTCAPRYEADTWRERMKSLIDLEQPQEAARDEMVASFNAGYRRARDRYAVCNSRARNYAAARAAQGDEIVDRLIAPLYETVSNDDQLPRVLRGAETPER